MTKPRLINSRIYRARLGKSWQHDITRSLYTLLSHFHFFSHPLNRNLHHIHFDFGLPNKLFKFRGAESNFYLLRQHIHPRTVSSNGACRWADSQWVNYFIRKALRVRFASFDRSSLELLILLRLNNLLQKSDAFVLPRRSLLTQPANKCWFFRSKSNSSHTEENKQNVDLLSSSTYSPKYESHLIARGAQRRLVRNVSWFHIFPGAFSSSSREWWVV